MVGGQVNPARNEYCLGLSQYSHVIVVTPHVSFCFVSSVLTPELASVAHGESMATVKDGARWGMKRCPLCGNRINFGICYNPFCLAQRFPNEAAKQAHRRSVSGGNGYKLRRPRTPALEQPSRHEAKAARVKAFAAVQPKQLTHRPGTRAFRRPWPEMARLAVPIIYALVHASREPVPSGRVAAQLREQIGLDPTWNGMNSFHKFVVALGDLRVGVSWDSPGYFYELNSALHHPSHDGVCTTA